MCLYIAGHQELLPLPHTQDRRGAVAADGSIWGRAMGKHRHSQYNHTVILESYSHRNEGNILSKT